MPTAAEAIAAWVAAGNLAARLYIRDAQAATLRPDVSGLQRLSSADLFTRSACRPDPLDLLRLHKADLDVA